MSTAFSVPTRSPKTIINNSTMPELSDHRTIGMFNMILPGAMVNGNTNIHAANKPCNIHSDIYQIANYNVF